MAEYRRRQGLSEKAKIFILSGKDDHIRRALLDKGWFENPNKASTVFHLKWIYTDCEKDYDALQAGQQLNHFPGNRNLTTKSGLAKIMQGISRYGFTCHDFFPRCYDIGEKTQLSEFTYDY